LSPDSISNRLRQRWRLKLAGVFVAGAGATAGRDEFGFDAGADAKLVDLEVADFVFGADGDGGVVDGAVGDGDERAAVFAVAATEAEGDFVVVEEAVLDGGATWFFRLRAARLLI